MANSFFIKDKISEHFKKNTINYVLSFLSIVVGVAIGVFLIFNNSKYTSLLTAADKNMFDIINGTISCAEIFSTSFLDIMLCLVIILVFSLNIYSSFLNYIFICYQTVLFVLSSAAIITLYGFTGVVNVIFFVIPINILNLLIVTIFSVCGIERARQKKVFGLGFLESFREDGYFVKLIICVLLSLAVCILHSFIIPTIIKSFVVINY